MRQYTSKSILFMTAITLSACSHLPQTTSQGATVVSAQTVTQALGVDLASLEQKATALKPFEYIHNQDHYIAYLSTQPELIKVQKNGQLAKFFYQAGKVSFVQDKTGVYQFNQSGDVIAAIDANGKKQHANPADSKALWHKASQLQKLFGYNKADASAGRVKTGSDAKVNYLCIAKIQQVAQTNRVFRSPENAVVTENQIKATVRLNGNQYYNMDCQLSDDKVSKLSLMKK
ncbi:TPA: hypothetical protein QB387_001327 [Pasteurella multocida]|nr:hypothetical protein [Pasteurella multocida]